MSATITHSKIAFFFFQSANQVSINAVLATSSPPRPPGSSVVSRSNLSTGLMRPDQNSRGSQAIKAMVRCTST